MKKIYISGNYIIAEQSGLITEYAMGKSVYTKKDGAFRILEQLDKGELVIAVSDAGNWYDEAGTTAFTESTLETFFRTSTGFNIASGGNGAGGGQTISWSRKSSSVAMNTILQHNTVGVSQVGVPIINDGSISKIGYSTRGTKNGSNSFVYRNWGVEFRVKKSSGSINTHLGYLSGENEANTLVLSSAIPVEDGDEIWCRVINGDGLPIDSVAYPVIEIIIS